MEATAGAALGCRDMVGTLRRVLVRRPRSEVDSWELCGWRAAPDPRALATEHEALCALLEDAGAEVVFAEASSDGNLDEIYAFDAVLVGDDAVILLQPSKHVRHGEPGSLATALERLRAPVRGRLEQPAAAEGGDLIRLDADTLLVGFGYRTNEGGVDALSELLPGVELVPFDLPHHHGAGKVLHLLSLLSPIDRDLVVAFPPLLPVRLMQLLEARGIEIVAVPEEELDTMGPNVLALGPRRALVVEGNPVTRRRLEAAGVDVVAYRGKELSKGDGGPTCLTLPLARD